MKNDSKTEQFAADLSKLLADAGDPGEARHMRAYMKQISFFHGVRSKERKRLLSFYISRTGLPLCDEMAYMTRLLWKNRYRELQYCGMEIVMKCTKDWKENDLELFTFMITNRSWWDTVDYIASNIMGKYFMRFGSRRNDVIGSWSGSGNLWLIRSALIFQLKYREKTDTDLLFKVIREHNDSDEFFIRKAIGWALRELSKTSPGRVRRFLDNTNLSGLSRREASKHL